MSYFGATGTSFGFLMMSAQGFNARVGCLIRNVGSNVMYVPWDQPQVLYTANLLTASIVGQTTTQRRVILGFTLP